MPKLRKKCKGNKKRTTLLAVAISAALLCSTPAYAANTIGDGNTPGLVKGVGNNNHTVESGETWLTWQHATNEKPNPAAITYGGNIIIKSDGIWRPLDACGVRVNYVGTLNPGTKVFEVYKDGIVDLSYKYGYEHYSPANWTVTGETATLTRGIAAWNPILHDGAIFRLNVGNISDTLSFSYNINPQFGSGETQATVKLQLNYYKNFDNIAWEGNSSGIITGTVNNTTVYLQKSNSTISFDNLDFIIDSSYRSYIDNALNKYSFMPTLRATETSDGLYKSYYIDYTALRTDLVSQGVFSAANAQLSMRNLWRIEDGLFWKRGEELRTAKRLGQSEGADGAWAQIWRGQYSFDGAYGSDFDQSYNGIQVGYDKQHEGAFYGGKLHTGLFLSMLNSDAEFHQMADGLYSSAGGNLESKGIGLYTSWLGGKGHYLDFTVRGSKLTNNYQFQDADGSAHANDYGTWTYGAGLRYGLQKDLSGGWYLEPQAGLTYGTMKGYSYMQDNGMVYNQDQVDMLTGRLGVTAGRHFGSGDKRGILYAKAAVNHDFKDGGSAHADAMLWDPALDGGNYRLIATLPVNTLAGKDTWYDFAVGASLQTGKDQNAFVELNKTAGGKVNTDWQVSAGLSWRFNGPSAKDNAAVIDTKVSALAAASSINSGIQAQTPAPETAAEAPVPPMAAGADTAGVTSLAAATPARQAAAGEAPAQETDSAIHTDKPASNADQAASVVSAPGSFTLEPLVVEAARPDWEKKLSPGTVSVIHVPEYKGEMKNLPDLLQTVPGVYVQRLQGTGHYSVARVRGSTGGQVNIYIDGVLVNSNADAAVDLSIIPIENVERIEVYRGYVPARFAGSPIGGAINIVTKKPQDVKGSITQGMRSFGGYTGNLELTAPAGSGSLLLALNRDQATGDFRYMNLGPGAGIVDPYTDTERHRMFNDYQNTDALLKWQDDHWFAKLTWQQNKTSFPQSTADGFADVPFDEVQDAFEKWGGGASHASPLYEKYRQRKLETTKSEFQFGRRETVGNLEWGWKLGTSYQLKEADSSNMKNPDRSDFLVIDNEFRNRRYEGSIDGSWQAGKGHLVEFLLNASRETMDVSARNAATWPLYDPISGSKLSNYAHMFKPHYEYQNYHFQVQDTMTLNRSGNLFFTPVLRAQKMDLDVAASDPDMNNWKYSYGLGLKKVQNEHWTFRGTYGTYYKFPNWYELFGDGVNLKSRWEKYSTVIGTPQFLLDNFVERGISWDLSANWQGKALNADSDVTLTYFNRHAQNLSSYSIDFYGFGYYTNLAAGNIQGLELENRMKWGRWDLLLAATWNDSIITASGSKATLISGPSWMAGSTWPWIPEWEYNVRLGYRFPGNKLSAFTEYHYLGKVAQFGISEDGSATYDALGITNVGLKYDLSSRIKLTAGVNDLFNKGPNQLWHSWTNRSGSIDISSGNVPYPQQGRTYYMTAQYFF